MMELEACVQFLQKLIQTKSLSCQEEDVAKLVKLQMDELGFDRTQIDKAGNVIGLLKGTGNSPAINFNTHLDHVDVGEETAWPFPPFDGTLSGGKIWGRGAVDIKGPLACQVFGIGSLIRKGKRPPGDVYVTAVVQEEVGGVGARYLVSHFQTPLVIVGEPSNNQLRIGHRGRVELNVTFRGKSSHASMPHLADNPLFSGALFIDKIKAMDMLEDPILGSSTMVPTVVTTDQTSPNVIPSEVSLTCDWRTVSGENSTNIVKRITELADQCLQKGITYTVDVPVYNQKTYSGLDFPATAEHPSFSIPVDDPLVRSAISILNDTIGPRLKPEVWRFATDGGYFAKAGQKVLGFGPGDDKLAHTIKESIEVSSLKEAIIGNRSLAMGLTNELNT